MNAPFAPPIEALGAAPPRRPALRYHGGKWRLAPWIISHFPRHRVYVEPFGGAGSVLLRKPRAFAEIYNDLDAEVVGLFEVLRDPAQAALLIDAVALTPYARAEFEGSYLPATTALERARRLLVRSWMAHGSSGLRGHRTGFRLGSMREHTFTAHDWAGLPEALPAIVSRLKGVAIECRPAASVMAREDRCDTLVYADPPYMYETRSQKRIGNDLYHGYRHELDDIGHAGEARTEVLWINPQAALALGHGPLFDTPENLAASMRNAAAQDIHTGGDACRPPRPSNTIPLGPT